MNRLMRFFNDESGVTAIEYALIAGTTALALIAVMPTIGTSLNATFTSISVAM